MGAHANPAQPRQAKSVVFELTLLSPAGATESRRKRTFTLDRSLRIGADAANHIVIDGEGIGAFHGRFIPGLDSPILVLSDSDAAINGVAVQGNIGLIPGDVVAIGEHQLRVSAHGMAQEGAASGGAVWQLVSDDGAASVQLTGDVVIGSADTSQIRLTDADIAKRHAQLVPREGTLWVRDLSDGATFVNEEPVSGARRMAPGDALRIGPHQFRIGRETRAAVERSRVTTAVAVVELPPVAVAVDSLPSELPSALDVAAIAADAPAIAVDVPAIAVVSDAPASSIPAVAAVHTPPAVWEIDEPVDMPTDEGPLPVESPARVAPDVAPKPRMTAGDGQRKAPRKRSGDARPRPRTRSGDARPKARTTPPAGDSARIEERPTRDVQNERPATPVQVERPATPVQVERPATPLQVERRATPVQFERRAAPVRAERRATPAPLERRASIQVPARAGTASRRGKRTPRWRVPLLIAVLTLVWAVAMRPTEITDRVSGVLDGRSVAASFDRVVEAGRSMQSSAVDWLRSKTANRSSEAPDIASTRAAAATLAPSGTADGESLVTEDILELQRNAALGDAVAIARLKELGDFYAELAASAMSRGDTAAAQRQMAMVVLLRSAPTNGEASSAEVAPAPVLQQRPASPVERLAAPVERPVSPVEQSVSRVDALVVEAQQLEARGAIVSPERRNAVSVLLEAMRLEPANEGAFRQLNAALGSLNARVDTLIANHQFAAAGTLLEQLARGGIPVLSNGNVRDRPSYVDAQSWRALAVSSLLVEADELIQQGLIATPGDDNAISRLESATRIDPASPQVEDMRLKSSGMLLLAAERADQQGWRDEARRLVNLAAYVRDGFGA